MLLHPAAPGRVYQQNHVGVYRSDDRGETWVALHGGLPTDFGFGLALDPNDGSTIFTTPLVPKEGSYRATEGSLRVYRRDGRGWTALTKGLPQTGAYVNVLREGMSNDTLDPVGVYVGTGTGQIFHTADAGRSWRALALYLPPVLSVSAAVV
jgi:hypothetical protein